MPYAGWLVEFNEGDDEADRGEGEPQDVERAVEVEPAVVRLFQRIHPLGHPSPGKIVILVIKNEIFRIKVSQITKNVVLKTKSPICTCGVRGYRQCFLFSQNIGYVTPIIIIFYYLEKIFSGAKSPNNILFNFEKGSTGYWLRWLFHHRLRGFSWCVLDSLAVNVQPSTEHSHHEGDCGEEGPQDVRGSVEVEPPLSK